MSPDKSVYPSAPHLSHLHPQGEDGHIWQLWKVSPLESLRLGPVKAHNSGFPSFFGTNQDLEKPFLFSCSLSNLHLAHQIQGLVTLGILYFLLRVFPFCLPEYPALFLPFLFVCLFCFVFKAFLTLPLLSSNIPIELRLGACRSHGPVATSACAWVCGNLGHADTMSAPGKQEGAQRWTQLAWSRRKGKG